MVITNRRLVQQKLIGHAFVRVTRLVSIAAILSIAGCNKHDQFSPVNGMVQWSGGSLAGHFVEVSLKDSQNTRGFGIIDEDGSFRLSRLVDGKTVDGLPSGEFSVRLVINDEGDGIVKKPKIPTKYLSFATSGWTIQVPAESKVVLNAETK